MDARWLRPGIVTVSAAVLVILIATGVGAGWRIAAALWFVLVCPGASLAGGLGLHDRFTEWALVAPLSLAVVVGTSIILFYGGVWSPDREFGLLLGLCLAGLTWSHFASRDAVKGDA
jgi:hypothetical protein